MVFCTTALWLFGPFWIKKLHVVRPKWVLGKIDHFDKREGRVEDPLHTVFRRGNPSIMVVKNGQNDRF